MPSNHLILYSLLLLLPSIVPSIRVFFNESVLRIWWHKYWSFIFKISPSSNEYSGLISFRMDWMDLLAVQGIFKRLLQCHSSRAFFLQHSASFIVQLSHPYMATGKTTVLTRWTFVSKVIYLLFNMLSRLVKIMLKILQARLQQYMNHELPDVQAGFRKARGTRDQIANIHWIIEKAREFQKNIYFYFIDYTKAFDCVDHNKLWKIFQEMGIRDHLTCLLRNMYADHEVTVRNGHGTTNWFQTVYCHPAYLTYMQSTSSEMLGWMKHKLESRLTGGKKWKYYSYKK